MAEDAVVAAARRAEQGRRASAPPTDWKQILVVALLSGGSMACITAAAVMQAASVFKAVGSLEPEGIRVLKVARKEVEGIQFPPGHPRCGVLYSGHPAVPSRYFTTAEFHRRVFEHKFSEAIRLLMALGATRIEVEHLAGWGDEFSARISVPLGRTGVDLGASGGQERSSGRKLLYRACFDGNDSPALPDDLIWYPHEDTWHVIAKGRLESGLREFSLTVQYEDDYGINAGLKLKAGKAGLDLGGKFEDHQATVWRIEGEFGRVLPGDRDSFTS